MKPRWICLWLNPEPWGVGDVSVARHKGGGLSGRVGPNPNLVAFQSAVRDALGDEEMMPPGEYSLTIYLWRQTTRYLDATDRVRQRNQADATNMLKGLEDALQGILFENDRDVREVRAVIREQGPDVEPRILIRLDMYAESNMDFMYVSHPEVDEALAGVRPDTRSDNSWPPKGGVEF